MTAAEFDPERCPLCGGPNACGLLLGTRNCWCFSMRIPESVLERIPVELQGLACVCEGCATRRRTPGSVAALMDSVLRGRR